MATTGEGWLAAWPRPPGAPASKRSHTHGPAPAPARASPQRWAQIAQAKQPHSAREPAPAPLCAVMTAPRGSHTTRRRAGATRSPMRTSGTSALSTTPHTCGARQRVCRAGVCSSGAVGGSGGGAERHPALEHRQPRHGGWFVGACTLAQQPQKAGCSSRQVGCCGLARCHLPALPAPCRCRAPSAAAKACPHP